MKFFTGMLRYFVSITTGVILIFIIIMLINNDDFMKLSTLIEIPALGLVTAFVSAAVIDEDAAQKQFITRLVIHYLLISAIVSAAGILFGWVNFTFGGILYMVLCSTGVYIFTGTVTYISSKKEAAELNDALDRKRAQQ